MRWLLAGLVLLSGLYFEQYPAVRFGTPDPGAPLTGLEQFANLLVAATVATFAFIAIRTIAAALSARRR